MTKIFSKMPQAHLNRASLHKTGGNQKMKKNTKLIIGVVALVVVIAALLGIYMATRPQTS